MEHDILFNCSECDNSFCKNHINEHPHQQPTAPQYTPMGRFAIDLSQISEYAKRQMMREPTKDDYERFLQQNPQVLTTGRESIDLFFGIMLIAWVFGFQPLLQRTETWQYIIVLTLIISPAFILHELAHKYMAIRYGKYARFTLVRQMAYFTFFAGLLGIPIAGPGATMILGRSTESENGIFAAAGPLTNFLIGTISLIIYIIIPKEIFLSAISNDLDWIFLLSAFINGVLGVFNLIPVASLDGRKILNWKPLVWIVLVVINAPVIIFSYPLLFG